MNHRCTHVTLKPTFPRFLAVGDKASFGAVVSNSIVHHIPEPIHVLREAVRVTKPGGWVAFEVGEVHAGKTKLEEAVLPCGIAATTTGNLVLADTQNHILRLITPAGVVTTL